MFDPKRVRIDIQGVVQGVGFRPFIFELASLHQLVGYVANNSDGVEIEVQGQPGMIDAFIADIDLKKPPLAFILRIRTAAVPLQPAPAMEIRPSRTLAGRSALLPPDVCVCADCVREMLDPNDRRFGYPFINCTNCGPRYTIIDDIPYDRDKTSMAGFAMCSRCSAEYNDPLNRRFHAQPNACWDCGPRLWLCDSSGGRVECTEPLRRVAGLLADGKIVAIKGLGGFHLAVDASNEEAVQRLRARKAREQKPLAVMCAGLAGAKAIGEFSLQELSLLSSIHRPIVVVPKCSSTSIASGVAPENRNIGVMLPYTPIHVLLMQHAPPWLVMTSGNLSEEPIATGNDEALGRLAGIADYFVLHNRDILVRNDDSVMRVADGIPRHVRRSRGWVPLPVVLSEPVACVLGLGGELKNTVCFTKGDVAFLSQHIGDLEHEAAVASLGDTIARLARIIDARPVAVACDEHPDYATSRFADEQPLPVVRVQHHWAHIASCMAEHGVEQRVIGVALDGTGFGQDGTIWGGEILVADYREFRRAGGLGTLRLAGGDAAAREPWRMALAALYEAFNGQVTDEVLCGVSQIEPKKRRIVLEMIASACNAPLTSSAGRLFDAISALCGLHLCAGFEAQAAIALEMAASDVWTDDIEGYVVMPSKEGDQWRIAPSGFTRHVVADLQAGVAVADVAARFHAGFASAFALACNGVRTDTGLGIVALSGGSFQNRLLLERLTKELNNRGFEVISHRSVPTNDGGISLGQAMIAARNIRDRQ